MLEDLGGKATQTIKSAKLAKYWAHAANEEMTARLNSIHVPMTKHNLGGVPLLATIFDVIFDL